MKCLCYLYSIIKTLTSEIKIPLPNHQGCQKVYFQIKNPNLGKFWRALKWKMFVYFMTIWNGIVCGHLVYFFPFWYVWTKKKSGNPANHLSTKVLNQQSPLNREELHFQNNEQLIRPPWRSGHRICLRNRRPQFDSRQGIRFFRENIAML
jgi:hypothetical protein